MKSVLLRFKNNLCAEPEAGMELVQVAILIAIAIVLGLIFKNQITDFVNNVFRDLKGSF